MPVPNGGDSVVSALRAAGVTTVFGIPASYTVEIYDAILRQGGIRSIVARNEQAAAFMADGYARRSGEPGVVVVTGGPGFGNTVTGLQTAYADSSPVVVIASDHNPAQRRAHPLGLPHEAVDQAALAGATGARVVRADDGRSVAAAVEETLAACRSGRPRPAVVLVSRAAMEAPETPRKRDGKAGAAPPRATAAEIEQVVGLLASATDPVVVVGAGVLRARAEAELAGLVAATGLPVVTTVPARHAADCKTGWVGVLDNAATRASVEGADLVLAVGTSFGSASTAGWTLRIEGTLVHVDIDPASLGQHYQPDLAIEADARSFLASLTEAARHGQPRLGGHGRSIEAATVSHPWTDPIDRALPSQGVTICGDVTMASRWIPGGVSLGPERRLMTPWNYMTLGWAYAAALGVQAAAPDDTVLAVMGDGGALFTLGELATAVEHGLPVCLLVYNNRSYGIIAEAQDALCEGRRFGVDLEQPDFVAAAHAFGIDASRAETPAELEAALRKHVGSGEPSLVEAYVDVADLGADTGGAER